jgi:hypothetical protein
VRLGVDRAAAGADARLARDIVAVVRVPVLAAAARADVHATRAGGN